MASEADAWKAFKRLKRLEAELHEGVKAFEDKRAQAVFADTMARIQKRPSKVKKEMLEPDWPRKAFDRLRAEWLKQLHLCLSFEGDAPAK